MRSLWFKARYVEPILAGEKRDTIRAKRPRFEPGDVAKVQKKLESAKVKLAREGKP